MVNVGGAACCIPLLALVPVAGVGCGESEQEANARVEAELAREADELADAVCACADARCTRQPLDKFMGLMEGRKTPAMEPGMQIMESFSKLSECMDKIDPGWVGDRDESPTPVESPADTTPATESTGAAHDDEALREAMGASIKGAEPHAQPGGERPSVRDRASGDPGADLDRSLRAVGAKPAKREKPRSDAKRARASAKWVLRRTCKQLSQRSRRLSDASSALFDYRLDTIGGRVEKDLLVAEASEKLSRCRMLRSPRVGDFPPHSKP